MIYCSKCKLEIVPYSVGRGAASDKDLDEMRQRVERDGRRMVFNPPPRGPIRCPQCRGETVEKST